MITPEIERCLEIYSEALDALDEAQSVLLENEAQIDRLQKVRALARTHVSIAEGAAEIADSNLKSAIAAARTAE